MNVFHSCNELLHDRKNFSKYIVFNFRSCYVLKKTSKVSMLMSMYCLMHDICGDSERIVFFHKRKEDLWNSEVWCSPFAPSSWLWLSVSAFLPPKCISRPCLSALRRRLNVHVRELLLKFPLFCDFLPFLSDLSGLFPPPAALHAGSEFRLLAVDISLLPSASTARQFRTRCTDAGLARRPLRFTPRVNRGY